MCRVTAEMLDQRAAAAHRQLSIHIITPERLEQRAMSEQRQAAAADAAFRAHDKQLHNIETVGLPVCWIRRNPEGNMAFVPPGVDGGPGVLIAVHDASCREHPVSGWCTHETRMNVLNACSMYDRAGSNLYTAKFNVRMLEQARQHHTALEDALEDAVEQLRLADVAHRLADLNLKEADALAEAEMKKRAADAHQDVLLEEQQPKAPRQRRRRRR